MLKMCGNSGGVSQYNKYTLPKVQWTQGIEYFDSINTFWSKQKLQKVLNSWSNTLQLDFVRQRARKNRKTSTNLSSNFEKSMY